MLVLVFFIFSVLAAVMGINAYVIPWVVSTVLFKTVISSPALVLMFGIAFGLITGHVIIKIGPDSGWPGRGGGSDLDE